MRGHGRSADPGPNHEWSVDELLGDMEAFLDALELDRVHYVGESLGAILGIAFAVRRPDRLRSLTLCAGSTTVEARNRKWFAVGYKDWLTALGTLGGGGWVKAVIDRTGALGGATPAQTEWIIREWSKTPNHVLQGLCQVVPHVNVEQLLSQVKVPTLVIAAARSPFISLQHQVMLRDSIPGARIAVVEGRGHEVYADDPETCTQAVIKFWRTLDLSELTQK